MAQSFHADVSLSNITAALKLQNVKLHREVSAHLSAQQEQAIRHVLEPQQLRIVTGYAGAGKSTMLEAAAQAWKHSGLNVIGGALSGKAADGLEKSSGIPSRTLASLQKSWEGGYNLLTNKDVLVIDEAGMVDVRQMAKIVNAVNKYGAKLVMVGDAEQLQPIMAGTPFKEMEEQIGSTSLSEIRRQKHDWQREASILLAEQKAQDALNMYQERGCVHMATTTESAISALVSDYMKDVEVFSRKSDQTFVFTNGSALNGPPQKQLTNRRL
jgi:ATP-dependent exoDNAse (exonuclease V) alpha subunit